MTICLITPPSCFLLDERVFLTLGILKVAACLENAGHVVEMLDTSGIEQFEDAVRDHALNSEAKVFGMTATTPQLPAAARIVKVIREARPDARIILGGPHVTLVCAALKREKKIGLHGRATRAYAQLEGMFDVLVAGDGEDAVFWAIQPDAPKFIDADNPAGSLFMTNERLNELPWPARHLVDVDSYHYTIEGHRSLSIIAQLGCPFASLTGDAFVFTENGFERISDLINGPGKKSTCVHGATISTHQLKRRVTTHLGVNDATHVIDEGKRQTLVVTAENGLEATVTPEHPFLTLCDGVPTWKKACELKPLDWLIMQAPHQPWPTKYVALGSPTLPKTPPGGFRLRSTRLPKLLTPELGWLIGFLLGDGCLPKDGRPEIHFAVTDEIEKRLKRSILNLFGVSLSIYQAHNTTKMRHGWLRSRAVRCFFEQCIGINPFDKLHVPLVIRKSPPEVIDAFLGGLHDADGYSGGGERHPYIVTVSKQFAKEIALLHLMMDRPPNISRINGTRPQFRIGLLHNDRIPTQAALYQSQTSGRWFWRNPRNPKRFVGIRRRTLAQSGLKHPLDTPGRHYVRVESVQPGEIETVYDLHVPKDHSFVANGLVVHNCGFCGGRESPMLRRIRTRSTQNIVNEIVHLHQTYGVTGIMFYDDELNVNQTMVELMNGIHDAQEKLGVELRLRGFIKSQLFTDQQAEAMYRAGFRWILVGFESGSERILENINKKANRSENTRCMEIAHRHGLKVKALMSIGHPGESEQTIMETRDWLLEVKPADFDCTVITTYPGTPYFDHAIRNKEQENVWTYTYPKTGDKLHAYELDYTESAGYYKGKIGEYQSFVFTDHLSPERLVELRDFVEKDVRAKLNIPFNQSQAALRYEHSMGQPGQLPTYILRRSKETCV